MGIQYVDDIFSKVKSPADINAAMQKQLEVAEAEP